MTFNAAIRLLCLFLFSSPLLKCVVAQDVGEFDFTPMMRGFDDMGDMQDHRRMASWGSWSWANLLCKFCAMHYFRSTIATISHKACVAVFCLHS